VSDLEQALRDELGYLWGDLGDAIHTAINGRWSIRCDNLEDRIRALTQLVGPTPWEQVGMTLLENGTYQRIHDDLGIRVAPDMQQVAELRARMAR
jgi:hypothetical protein